MRAIYESTLVHSRLSTAHLSFLAGAGTVLVMWWMKEKQRRNNRWFKYFFSDEGNDLLLNEDDDDDTEKCIYLDYNGTTPISPHVLQSMMPYLTKHFGNPSSGHAYGQAPRQAMDRARVQILQLLGRPNADPSSIWFTACGTESDNMAIQCALQANAHREWNAQGDEPKLPHIVTSNVEHPAIEAYLQHLQAARVCTVTYVPVQTDGRVRAADVMNACQAGGRTILVTLMWANNETGALQPVRQVAQYCRQQGILFHTDAAQAVRLAQEQLTLFLQEHARQAAFTTGHVVVPYALPEAPETEQ